MPHATNQREGSGVDPVTLALSGVLCIAAWCSWRVIIAARAVIEASEDKETYVLFITDDGMKSDNQQLAEKVNQGIQALRSAESEATLLVVVCCVLGLALGWRLMRGLR